MDLVLRPAAPQDEPWARELNSAAYRAVIERQFGFWNDRDQQRQFEDKWAQGQYQLICLAGVPVGVLWAAVDVDHVFINELLILPEQQGLGIGTQVLRDVLGDASARNVPVRLKVLLRNRARALYERLGFKVEAVTATHFLMTWTP